MMETEKTMHESIYQFLILNILVNRGGSAEIDTVYSAIKKGLEDHLSKKDLEDYKSGGEIWKINIRFARQHLIEKGCLKKGSPRGVWEITDKGRKQCEEWLELPEKNPSQSKGAV